MGKESKLLGLAKENKKPVAAKKSQQPKVVEKPKSPEEVRDEKAKQRVQELLAEVPVLTSLGVVEESQQPQVEEPVHGVDWLEEQVESLSSENQQLRLELETSKYDYSRLYEDFQKRLNGGGQMIDETTKANIVTMFNELQANMLGQNRERTPWTIVNIKYLLGQMISMFPFIEQYKRF